MPDAAPFLAAVASAPDDDLPRLVFADWLDEHGDHARAEFIRLQCHTARVGPLDPTWAPAKLREFELFKANETKWRPGRRVETSHTLFAHWRRGFPASVDLDDLSAGWMASGGWCNGSFHLSVDTLRPPHVWPAVGPVREVSLSGWTPGSGDILRHERLRPVQTIRLKEWYAGVRTESVENFTVEFAQIQPGQFPELHSLMLNGEMTLQAFESLASAPLLHQLKKLHIQFPLQWSGRESTDAWRTCARQLFRGLATQVECLSLFGVTSWLSEEFCAREWSQLRSLSLMQAQEDQIGTLDFSKSPRLSSLGLFPPPFVRLNAVGLEAFRDGWPERSLRVLALGKVPVGDLRRWLTTQEGSSLEVLSAHVQGGRLQTEELTTFPLTRGVKLLAGSFTKAGFAGLKEPTTLQELHTICNVDPTSASGLKWRGGDRTVICREESHAATDRPSRLAWCSWYDAMFD